MATLVDGPVVFVHIIAHPGLQTSKTGVPAKIGKQDAFFRSNLEAATREKTKPNEFMWLQTRLTDVPGLY